MVLYYSNLVSNVRSDVCNPPIPVGMTHHGSYPGSMFRYPRLIPVPASTGTGNLRVWVRVRPPIPGGIPVQLPNCTQPSRHSSAVVLRQLNSSYPY
jgi:hypothetical protein